MRFINALFFIVFFIVCSPLLSNADSTSPEPNSPPIDVRILIDESLRKDGFEEDIKKWLAFSKNILLKESGINIRFIEHHPITIPKKNLDSWHHHKQRDIFKEWVNEHRRKDEIIYAFVSATDDAGKCMSSMGISLTAIDSTKTQSRKWLVLHEFAHLFGAPDVVLKDHVMNDECILEYGDEPLQFDPHTLAIMRIANEYLQSTKRGFFSFAHIPPDYGKRIIPHLNTLLFHAKHKESMHCELGEYYLINSQYKQALSEFDRSLQIVSDRIACATPSPKDFQEVAVDLIQYNKGLCLVPLGKYHEALSLFQLSLTSGPENSDKHFWISRTYHILGEIDPALRHSENSLRLNPSNPPIWHYHGVLLLTQIPANTWEGDEMDKAIHCFNKAIELDPSIAISHAYLGAIYIQRNDLPKAEPYLQYAKKNGFEDGLRIKKKGETIHVSFSKQR